jgi:hypothetical protein
LLRWFDFFVDPPRTDAHTHLDLDAALSYRFERNHHMRRLISIALFSILALEAGPLMAAPQRRAGAGGTAGSLKGTARTPTGRTLPDVEVQARDLQTGQVVGRSTTNASGAFAFAGLTPASYVVEAISQTGAIVGSSAATSVAAGGVATAAVSASATAAAATASTGAGTAVAVRGTMGAPSTAMVVTSVAASARIAGAVVTARDASPTR